jgi:putative transposase
MKTSRTSEAQILSILRQVEGGVPVAQLCREHGFLLCEFQRPCGNRSHKRQCRPSA